MLRQLPGQAAHPSQTHLWISLGSFDLPIPTDHGSMAGHRTMVSPPQGLPEPPSAQPSCTSTAPGPASLTFPRAVHSDLLPREKINISDL